MVRITFVNLLTLSVSGEEYSRNAYTLLLDTYFFISIEEYHYKDTT
jgi:hypothetical protein